VCPTSNDSTPRSRLAADDSVLRLSETEAERRSGYQADTERMIMNMGPQHPSTHGVLRLVLELEGELIVRSKPVIGYLHTGMEKTGEVLTYAQGSTNVTRMDCASPLFSELAFSLATETLLGIEVPERAQWIRMLMCEVNRLSSHLLFMATNGMDLGAVSMMLYGWRARRGAALPREGHRPADEPQLHPPRRRGRRPARRVARLRSILEALPDRLDEFDTLMSGQPIWQERLQGVGVITAEEAIALGDRPDPAFHRLRLGPAPRPAVSPLRRGRLRRDRRHARRLLRSVRHPARRDPRVDAHPAPDPRSDAHGRLSHPGQEGHAAAALASTSRWRR
jgi:NADH-quinone oxidoreductase subunit D